MATVYTFLFGYDIFILLTSENWGFIMTDWGHMIPRSIGPPCRLIVGKNFLWSGSKWYLQQAHQFLERLKTKFLHKKIWFKTKILMNHRSISKALIHQEIWPCGNRKSVFYKNDSWHRLSKMVNKNPKHVTLKQKPNHKLHKASFVLIHTSFYLIFFKI